MVKAQSNDVDTESSNPYRGCVVLITVSLFVATIAIPAPALVPQRLVIPRVELEVIGRRGAHVAPYRHPRPRRTFIGRCSMCHAARVTPANR